eukprot:5644305-Alexandrium_andersonii.AAC.1
MGVCSPLRARGMPNVQQRASSETHLSQDPARRQLARPAQCEQVHRGLQNRLGPQRRQDPADGEEGQ